MESRSVLNRFKNAWNVFLNRDPTTYYTTVGASTLPREGRRRLTRGKDRTIITSIFNRISVDVAAIRLHHVKNDEEGRFLKNIPSSLDYCLNDEANIDQTGRNFIQDVVLSMLDEGHVVIVPVETDDNPDNTGSYTIYTMRVGKVVEWYSQHVRVEVYNEITGRRQEVLVHKRTVGIVENPFYTVMNEQNSTMQRLVRKLNILDKIDENSNSGRLDMIIQLPYMVKTETRKKQADERRQLIEDQLTNSKYGVAYIDGSEKIVQLNRPIDNNLMAQIEYLTRMLYSQLGITSGVMDGSADDKTMTNYTRRTIEPILYAIAEELRRKFLTKTARTQGQSISFFSDPFSLSSIEQIAEVADKMTRNEIMTSNEVRQKIGLVPSNDPKADELRNKNLSAPAGEDQLAPNQNGMEALPPPEAEGEMSADEVFETLTEEQKAAVYEIISNITDDEKK